MSTPDQFRVGETWISPRGKRWYVERITSDRRAVLRAPVQRGEWRPAALEYRNTHRVDGWTRVDP